MKLTIKAKHETATVEDGRDTQDRRCVVLNVGYPGAKPFPSWCGMYLTRKRAEKLRDWLTKWLEKSGGDQ